MRLHIENFGPIRLADVTLGDLNISVGPLATGKSLFRPLLKLLFWDGQALTRREANS